MCIRDRVRRGFHGGHNLFQGRAGLPGEFRGFADALHGLIHPCLLYTSDPELKSLWEDHVLYEKQVGKLEGKAFRTPTEEQTLKQLKKQKLEGLSLIHICPGR